MQNKILLLCTTLFLAGCNETTKVFDKPVLVDRPELILPTVMPATQNDVEWIVLTPNNIEAKIKEMGANGGPVVLFAVTPAGYEALAINAAEMRRYVIQQNTVIAGYKKYYRNYKLEAQK
jgi:hypothetical protein